MYTINRENWLEQVNDIVTDFKEDYFVVDFTGKEEFILWETDNNEYYRDSHCAWFYTPKFLKEFVEKGNRPADDYLDLNDHILPCKAATYLNWAKITNNKKWIVMAIDCLKSV